MKDAIGSAAPDLLGRFVPTPFSRSVSLGNSTLSVDSNDQGLLSIFGEPAVSSAASEFHLRILRDDEFDVLPQPPVRIESESTAVVAFGRAAILAYDRPRRQFFAFIGRGISIEWIQSHFVPILQQFCLSAALPYRNLEPVRAKIHQHASSMPLASKS